MADDVRRRRPPYAMLHHGRLVLFVDQALARRAAVGRGFRLAVLPFDMLPQDLGKAAAGRARHFEHPLIARAIAAHDMAGGFIQRRRADNDLPVGKAQRAALGQRDRIAFGRNLDRVGFVHDQNAGGMSAQISRRLARHHLQAAALEQPMA